MREIKFKGIRSDNNKWTFGSLVILYSGVYIADETTDFNDFKYAIIPKTRCEFIGLKDRLQNDIYESDKCKYITPDGIVIGEVVYERQACAYWFKWFDGAAHRYKELRATESDGETWIASYIEVIGNIHEPESKFKEI